MAHQQFNLRKRGMHLNYCTLIHRQLPKRSFIIRSMYNLKYRNDANLNACSKI